MPPPPIKIFESRLLPTGFKNHSSSKFTCQVVLLDNSTFTTSFEKHSSIKGQVLFHEVCAHLKLPSTNNEYFGLQFTSWEDGDLNWLEMAKEIRLQRCKPYSFQFAVRFYPEDTSLLSQTARELFCLQIKDLLIRGKFLEPVAVRLHAILDAYFAQFSLGDYSSKKHFKGYLQKLLGRFFVAPNGLNSDKELSEEIYEAMVAGIHKLHVGKSRDEAVKGFLEVASKLPFCGISLHQGATDSSGNPVLLGICKKGIAVYDFSCLGEPRTLQYELTWEQLVVMQQHNRKVTILTLNSEKKDAKKYSVRFHGHFGHRKGKRFVKDASEHQKFFCDSKKVLRNRASSFTEPDSITRTLQEIDRTERRYATVHAKIRRKSTFGRVRSSLKKSINRRLRSNSTEPTKEQLQLKRASVITVEEYFQ